DVRRFAEHRSALARGSVAGADQYADLRQRRIEFAKLAQRTLEVLLHVVAQRPQRREVEDLRLILQCRTLACECVNRGEVSRDGLPGPGRRGDEHVPAGADVWPALSLRVGRLAKAFLEPALDCRMK